MARNDLQPYPVNRTLKPNKDDLALAVAQDSWNCLLARTIQRTYPDAVNVRVNRKTVAWSDKGTDERYFYDTPDSAVENIIKPLDEGRPEDIKLRPVQLRGGRVRGIDHHERREARNTARVKLAKVPPAQRDKTHWSHAGYERYVAEGASA